MQDIADACGLTKAGLYHHVATKEALLIAIMEYGMDLFEEVVLLEDSFRQAMQRGQIRTIDPTLASFSFLGSVLWTYKWYRPDGRLSPQQLSDGTIDLFFNGLTTS